MALPEEAADSHPPAAAERDLDPSLNYGGLHIRNVVASLVTGACAAGAFNPCEAGPSAALSQSHILVAVDHNQPPPRTHSHVLPGYRRGSCIVPLCP